MKIIFAERAWEDYLYWQAQDKKTLDRINTLIKECSRTPFSGIGKPEPLRGALAGWWSRRIDREHGLVYRVQDDSLQIAQCRYDIDGRRYVPRRIRHSAAINSPLDSGRIANVKMIVAITTTPISTP